MAEVLAAGGRAASKAELRGHAIAINAVLDGLWIEGSMAGDDFAPGELVEIGIGAVEKLLGVELDA